MEVVCANSMKGTCNKGSSCKYRHPMLIGITKKPARQTGVCFCGSHLLCFPRKNMKEDGKFTFHVVCARTRKSMHRCK